MAGTTKYLGKGQVQTLSTITLQGEVTHLILGLAINSKINSNHRNKQIWQPRLDIFLGKQQASKDL
jgi:hypothetical protein